MKATKLVVFSSQVVCLLQVFVDGEEQVLKALLEHLGAEAVLSAAVRQALVEVEEVAGVADGVEALVEAEVEGAATGGVIQEGAALVSALPSAPPLQLVGRL